MKRKITFALILLAGYGFSQSTVDKNWIAQRSDIKALDSLKSIFQAEELERSMRIENFLASNPAVKRRQKLENGAVREIFDINPDGTIAYYSTSNSTASRTARANRLYSGGTLGLNVQGQGMTVGVWDGGSARTTHVEFPDGKVFSGDGGELDDHATHVMGTVVAAGLTPTLRGIAFDASARSYDWNSDYSEMANEAANGLLVSNHSYWISGNGGVGTWMFGSYDSRARGFDLIAVAAPFYLGVTAAGNDRNDFSDALVGPYLSEKFGYNLTRGMQNAKNFLTVGAVSQVLTYTGPNSVNMSDFSSWGPTDDGRIKPEVVTKGVSVRSTLASSDTASGIQQGTSMASPGVAGTALLLQQHYHNVNNQYMRAATLKGLICHTADEAGEAPGPDYSFGWGLINAEAAANAITQNNNTALISQLTLANATSYSITVASSGTTPLMASISWTDRAGTANNSQQIDPVTKNLINDLDIRITKDGTTYFPWTLDRIQPNDPAIQTADNSVDNFEKINVYEPSGTYTITVSHKGNLVGGNQNFSLIVTGPALVLSSEDLDRTKPFVVFPNPSKGFINVAYEATTDRVQIQLFDMSGRVVKNLDSSALNNAIDISDLTNGVYILKCNDGSKTVSQKIVLSK